MMQRSRQGGLNRPKAKKIVIRGLTEAKVSPGLPDGFRESSWLKLNTAVSAMYDKSNIATPLEELYQVTNFLLIHRFQSVGDLCQHGQQEWLYHKLQAVIKSHMSRLLDIVKGWGWNASDHRVGMVSRK